MPVVAEWPGFCPICKQETVFRAEQEWFRDHLLCTRCQNGSIPRERALMVMIDRLAPNWRAARIHESSPATRGVSVVLQNECPNYIPTQFFPDIPPGALHQGVRCENLEQQTFRDNEFDLVVTQDVMEHVFDPAAAYREIYRTLKPGGLHLHTTPIYKQRVETECRAKLAADGQIQHLAEPEYHGNPIDNSGSLVTFHYGYDLHELIAQWTPFSVEIVRFHDRRSGIVAEFSEVLVCRK